MNGNHYQINSLTGLFIDFLVFCCCFFFVSFTLLVAVDIGFVFDEVFHSVLFAVYLHCVAVLLWRLCICNMDGKVDWSLLVGWIGQVACQHVLIGIEIRFVWNFLFAISFRPCWSFVIVIDRLVYVTCNHAIYWSVCVNIICHIIQYNRLIQLRTLSEWICLLMNDVNACDSRLFGNKQHDDCHKLSIVEIIGEYGD